MKRPLLVTDDYLQLYKTLQLFITLHEMQTYTNIFTNAKKLQANEALTPTRWQYQSQV
jgi:hypothetical protein